MDYQWDPAKAKDNVRKHGVEFADAIAVFDDPEASPLKIRIPKGNSGSYQLVWISSAASLWSLIPIGVMMPARFPPARPQRRRREFMR
jgi:hypothetical protein